MTGKTKWRLKRETYVVRHISGYLKKTLFRWQHAAWNQSAPLSIDRSIDRLFALSKSSSELQHTFMNSLVGQRFQRQSIPACLALASSFWFYRKCSCDDHHPTRRRVFWPWARRQLPRRIHQGDIDLTMSPRCIRERQNDENQLRRLIEEAQNSGDAISHQSRLYELLYGSGVTPQDRQNFLAQYGCTGWTPKILERITEIAKDRGIVEVGAGHGQWARALMDHVDGKPDFCLAYDNFSNLPLKGAPLVFPVRQCSPDLHCLAQWSARGRVLLLVFPPPTDLAVQAARVYTDCHTQTDDNAPVIIYV